MDKTVVELFAGVGGFRVGLNDSNGNWDFVMANQWEPSRKTQDAFNCYISHYGDLDVHINENVNKIDKNNIPNHTLLVGGFPCQDYSVAATQAQGIQGKKGVLWWDIYDIIKAKNPSFVILENVDRLLKSPSNQRGRDFGIILACFAEQGYCVEWRIINAAEYGFPQRRRRTFIFAFKNTTNYFNNIINFRLEDWTHREGFFQREFPATPRGNVNYGEFTVGNIVDVSDNFQFEFLNSGAMHNGHIFTSDTIPNYDGVYKILTDILEENVDESYYLGSNLEDWQYMKGAKKIERVSKTGHKYIFAEGPIAFPDPIEKAARTMLTSEASKNRSTHIINDPNTNRLRKLTPLECERLNGFPDNWTNTGMSERFRYFCMGNALVVGLVTKMGNVLNEIIEREP